LILIACIGIGLKISLNNQLDDYLDKATEHHQLDFEQIIAALRENVALIYQLQIDNPRNLALMAEASRAEEARKEELRERLYRLNLPTYDILKQYDYRQVHFHLPDGTSFLRMHKPEAYGDELIPYRRSLKLLGRERKTIEGFEVGRHFHAYRSIYPLFYKDDFVGSIGISAPFYAIQNKLSNNSDHYYRFMVHNTQLQSALVTSGWNNYLASEEYVGFFYEKADYTGEWSTRLDKLDRYVSGEALAKLKMHQSFTIFKQIEKVGYVVSFVVIRNIEDKFAGYLISYSEDKNPLGIINRSITHFATASLLLLLLFTRHLFSVRKLKKQVRFTRRLVDAIPLPVYYKGRNGHQQNNLAYKKLLETYDEYDCGKELLASPRVLELEQDAQNSGVSEQAEIALNHAVAPSSFIVSVSALRFDAKESGIIASLQNIDELKNAEVKLNESYSELQQIFDTAAGGMRVVNFDYVVLRVNQTMLEMIGKDRSEVVGSKCYDCFPGADCETMSCPLRRIQNGQQTDRHETVKRLHDGTEINVIVATRTFYNEKGEPIGIIEDFHDITALKQVENSLRESESRFRHAFESAAVGMALLDMEGRFLDANDSLYQILGYTRQELLSKSFQDVTHPDDVDTDHELNRQLLGKEIPYYQVEKNCIHKNSHIVCANISISLVNDTDGKPLHLVLQVSDITARKKAEAKISHMALHDALTGLANRVSMQNSLERMLMFSKRYDQKVGLFFIDLDGFKAVNDTYGHEYGDMLLIVVAERLKTDLRESDFVARIGGDEFVILLPHLETVENALGVADKIIDKISRPYYAHETELLVGASIGIAFFPDHANNQIDLIKNADKAMYKAKANGKNRYEVYEPAVQDLSDS
jgi:diguanylate cyclase (GGDEF)-like protein/PAS domain S-box-containing protein